jgi:hypothetical protein
MRIDHHQTIAPLCLALWTPRGDITTKVGRDLQHEVRLQPSGGSLYCLLWRRLESLLIPTGRSRVDVERDIFLGNFQMIFLGLAAKEGLLLGDGDRIVQDELIRRGGLQEVNMAWCLLRLFGAVRRVAISINAETPAFLADPREAFGLAVLRGIAADVEEPSSKHSYADSLMREAKALAHKQNPFCEESEPEVFKLVALAFMLSHWDKTVRDREAMLPNSERQDRAERRKEVKDCLSAYIRAVRGLARDQDRNPKRSWVHRNAAGKIGVIGPHGRFEPIKAR